MFALMLVGLRLAPLGLLILLWNMFPQDGSIHPIYRETGVETEVRYAPSSQLKTLKHKLRAAAKRERYAQSREGYGQSYPTR